MRSLAGGVRTQMRVLELFSGIGGMRMGVEGTWKSADISFTAVDINPAANSVYAAHFGEPPMAKSVESLPKTIWSSQFDIWTMSPPCQPFSRNNTTSKRDTADPRCSALSQIVSTLALPRARITSWTDTATGTPKDNTPESYSLGKCGRF